MKKKPSTGERIAQYHRAFTDNKPLRLAVGCPYLARRINRAIAAERRKERERCIQDIRAYGLADTDAGKAVLARMADKERTK